MLVDPLLVNIFFNFFFFFPHLRWKKTEKRKNAEKDDFNKQTVCEAPVFKLKQTSIWYPEGGRNIGPLQDRAFYSVSSLDCSIWHSFCSVFYSRV